MSSPKRHMNQLKELIASIEEGIAPFLNQAEDLEKLKKQLQILTQRISVMQKSGEDVRPELTAQKIKLALRIDEIEEALFCAVEFEQLGSSLKKNYADYKDCTTAPRNVKLINQFDGIIESAYGASKSERLLKEKIKKMSLNELAKLINAICRLNGDNSLYVFNEKIVSKNDLNFHDAFFNTLDGRFIDVLRFSNVSHTKFTLSEFLQLYANYTLKRHSRNLIF